MFFILKNNLFSYKLNYSLNNLWALGSLIGIFVLFQIIVGSFLFIHFIKEIESPLVYLLLYSFNYISFNREMHNYFAFFLFILLFLHIAKSLWFKNYLFISKYVWFIGFLLLFLMFLLGFSGYVLPFNQMGCWGMTVIMNILSIFFGGINVIYWFFGGFSIDCFLIEKIVYLHVFFFTNFFVIFYFFTFI